MEYKFSPIENNIFAISDKNLYTSYLIIGDKKAFLIDTCAGIGNIEEEIRNITKKPLIVVNSHAHPDHCGANYIFGKIYASEITKKELLRYKFSEINKAYDYKIDLLGDIYDDNQTEEDIKYNIEVIDENTIFNLGNIEIECINTPGHTMGCMSFYIPSLKIIFTSDFIKPGVWVFLENSDINLYRKSLEKVSKIEIDAIYGGHIFEKQEKQIIFDLIKCVDEIIDNPKIGKKANVKINENALIHRYNSGEIFYI